MVYYLDSLLFIQAVQQWNIEESQFLLQFIQFSRIQYLFIFVSVNFNENAVRVGNHTIFKCSVQSYHYISKAISIADSLYYIVSKNSPLEVLMFRFLQILYFHSFDSYLLFLSEYFLFLNIINTSILPSFMIKFYFLPLDLLFAL